MGLNYTFEMVYMAKESKFQDNIIEENLYKNIVEEVVNTLICQHMDEDLEESIINGLDDD